MTHRSPDPGDRTDGDSAPVAVDRHPPLTEALREQLERLRTANVAFAAQHPGEGGARQPVHTVYGGGHLFRADTAPRLGRAAQRALEEFAPDAVSLAQAVGGGSRVHDELVYERVREKLRLEPVEDFRIDFEDGYGTRADSEEDSHVAAAAREVAAGLDASTLPPFIGLRIKALTEETRSRALRTLELFLSTLLQAAGRLPDNFVVTLPKVTIPEQVELFVALLALLEERLGLADASLRFELMVETPQLVIGSDGRSALPRILQVAGQRLRGAHFGTYDYTALLNITAAHQRMQHLACDFARHSMQVALAGTGVWLSDGSTTVLPVPVHRAGPDGPPLTDTQAAENRAAVHRAWRMHHDDVRHSLVHGFYQGWDLHPAQLVSRYAAVFGFFLEGLDAAGDRLRNFVDKAGQATLVGNVFDDAATGQGLLAYFLRAISAGAITEAEAVARTGLKPEEIRERSFVRILEARR